MISLCVRFRNFDRVHFPPAQTQLIDFHILINLMTCEFSIARRIAVRGGPVFHRGIRSAARLSASPWNSPASNFTLCPQNRYHTSNYTSLIQSIRRQSNEKRESFVETSSAPRALVRLFHSFPPRSFLSLFHIFDQNQCIFLIFIL